MRLIAGDQATRNPARAKPHTLGSAPSACVLVCSLYINHVKTANIEGADLLKGHGPLLNISGKEIALIRDSSIDSGTVHYSILLLALDSSFIAPPDVFCNRYWVI